MRKKKTAERSEFTDEDGEIIEEITITLAIMFDNIINNLSSQDILEHSSRIASSMKYQTIVAYVIRLQSLYGEQGRFTSEIKEEIAKMLSEERQRGFLNNESVMSKVLKNFERNGVIFKIKGKKEIKAQSPRSLRRKLKTGRPRRVGHPIISKLTKAVEDYKRILSNPKALGIINHNLLKYRLVEKTYSEMIQEVFDAFKKGDKKFFNALKMYRTSFPNIDDGSLPDPELFQKRINSLSDAELKSFQQQTVNHFLKNPSTSIFFIFSLSKLGSYSP